MRVESARPTGGRQRDTNVAENGSSATAASASVGDPLIRTSNRDTTLVSRTNSPWAIPALMSPAQPLMAKVDSSTRVTSPEFESSCATVPREAYAVGLPLMATVPALGTGQSSLWGTGAGDRANSGAGIYSSYARRRNNAERLDLVP